MMLTPEQAVERAYALGFTLDDIGDLLVCDLLVLLRLDIELSRVADENGLVLPAE